MFRSSENFVNRAYTFEETNGTGFFESGRRYIPREACADNCAEHSEDDGCNWEDEE